MARNILNGGMYLPLGEVYRNTTVPKKKPNIASLLHGKGKKGLEPLFNHINHSMDTEILTEHRDLIEVVPGRPNKMPAVNYEEAALLGCMDDIELRNVQLQIPSSRRLSDATCGKVRVRTDTGEITVAVQGDRSKPAILTYNDIGLNYKSFQTFFNYVDMRVLIENFCIYHVTAPGQEEGAPTLPDDYVYPSMDELSNQINYLLSFFAIRSFIGFGVGAGANILSRFALANPQKVEALALINCTSSQAGWIEWAYQKIHSRSLRHSGMTQPVIDYLIWHHFGRLADERNHDLAYSYRMYFTKNVNPNNLAKFFESYVRRSDLGIGRGGVTLKVPVLNITGALSPHVEDTVTFNGRLDPSNSTWMKISDCGMVLEEQPGKISEAFRLFLQGEGYVAPLSPTKMVLYQRLPEGGRRRACRLSPVIRITENPISEAVAC